MDDLYTVVDNVDKDNSFEVIQILKESRFEKTEKVRALNGREYVRKYFFDGANFSKEKLAVISGLNHPNLPVTHDNYELADCSVIIQDFIYGRRLSKIIETKGNIDSVEAIHYAISLCDAVEYMHGQLPNPLIHRDIKPDNIILGNDGNLKLIDFGAIREYKNEASRDTIYIGIPGYASPEQFGFGQTDIRTDIYAIGMTINHMITGKIPERGEDYSLPRSGLGKKDEALFQVIETATRFDPKERYENVSVLKEALKKYEKQIYKQSADDKPSIDKSISKVQLNERVHNKTALKSNDSEKKTSKRKMYPIHNNLPFAIKVALLPIHFIIIGVMVYGLADVFIYPTGFGRTDDLLLLGENIVLVLWMAFCYIIGFNLFNINDKWKFFSKNRIVKKLLLSVAAFVIVGIVFIVFQTLHSEAYNLANSAGS